MDKTKNINKQKKVFTCSECGGMNVETKMWVNPNDLSLIDNYQEYDHSDAYCKDCEERVELVCAAVKYYIIDATSNDPAMTYVADSHGSTIHTYENCMNFDTEGEAEEYIQKKSWQDWAGVIDEIMFPTKTQNIQIN